MLSKCANPDCTMEFKYFRYGRLFEFNVGDGGSYDNLAPQKGSTRELFWLCHECSRKFNLECAAGRIVPTPRRAKESRVA
ncbi:MAG: hypothetical protein ACXVZR_12565 [Terriglobales bacterium]